MDEVLIRRPIARRLSYRSEGHFEPDRESDIDSDMSLAIPESASNPVVSPRSILKPIKNCPFSLARRRAQSLPTPAAEPLPSNEPQADTINEPSETETDTTKDVQPSESEADANKENEATNNCLTN